LCKRFSTGGRGGVSGNAGGVAADGRLIAVVNFGSQSVSLFDLTHAGLVLTDVVTTMSPPVSVTFGYGHLYVLGTTSIESHKLYGEQVGHRDRWIRHASHSRRIGRAGRGLRVISS
jgi:DNA-binding beta-propeller fold protein YncE